MSASQAERVREYERDRRQAWAAEHKATAPGGGGGEFTVKAEVDLGPVVAAINKNRKILEKIQTNTAVHSVEKIRKERGSQPPNAVPIADAADQTAEATTKAVSFRMPGRWQLTEKGSQRQGTGVAVAPPAEWWKKAQGRINVADAAKVKAEGIQAFERKIAAEAILGLTYDRLNKKRLSKKED